MFEDSDQLRPGAAATAGVWALAPEHLPNAMAPGLAFDFVEGHRVVGHARALEVLEDPTPFPVGDLADAKTQPLTRA